jgi:hypothetical protein
LLFNDDSMQEAGADLGSAAQGVPDGLQKRVAIKSLYYQNPDEA